MQPLAMTERFIQVRYAHSATVRLRATMCGWSPPLMMEVSYPRPLNRSDEFPDASRIVAFDEDETRPQALKGTNCTRHYRSLGTLHINLDRVHATPLPARPRSHPA